MFTFFNRRHSRRRPRRAVRGRTLRLESLERRAVLSAVPVIDALTFTQDPWGGVTINGHVVDESPDGLTVTLTGAFEGSATVDADGNFSTSSSGAQLGAVSATVVDGDNQQSAPTTVNITSNTPVITSFSVAEGDYGYVIVTGQVTDEQPGGLTVNLAGVVQGSITTESDGRFSATVSGTGQLGTISATVTDWFGQRSTAATASITSDVPDIINFSASVDAYHQLRIEGEVTDESPQGLAVVVTWLSQSYTVWADDQGHFSWSCEVSVGQEGWANARTNDWWGQASNEPAAFVAVV